MKHLIDDADRLLDLVHANQVARQRIALIAGRYVELQLWVDEIWAVATQVERHAARPQVWPSHAHLQRCLCIEDAEATRAAHEDLVLVDQGQVRVDLGCGAAHPGAEAAHELVVQIAVHSTDSVVVVEELLAGERGKHVDDLVAFDERPKDRGDAAKVERHPALEEGVAGDAVELHREHADVLRASWHVDIHQLLKGGDGGRLAEE